MAQQELNYPKIFSLLVNQIGLGSAHWMGAVERCIESKFFNPSMKNTIILSGWYVLSAMYTRLKKIVRCFQSGFIYQAMIDSPVFGVISNWTGLPVFCWTTCVRLRTERPQTTSDTLSLTRSQPRSLLSSPRLNSARSRSRPSSSKRTLIPHICEIWTGFIWPIMRFLFQGVWILIARSCLLFNRKL